MNKMIFKRIVNTKNVGIFRKCCDFQCITSLTTNTKKIDSTFLFWRPQSRFIHITAINNKIVSFHLSDIGEGIREVVIKEWFVKVGDRVRQFDSVCEVQSDKAAVTITSRYDGVVTRLHHAQEAAALVGQPLLDIELDEAPDENEIESPEKSTDTNSTINEDIKQKPKVLTTPAVRRIAAQFEVDLSTVKPTGKNERILKEDLLAHLNISAEKSNEVPANIPRFGIDKSVQQPRVQEDQVVPMIGFTKAMFKSMSESLNIPHFVYSDEYNVTKLVKLRAELKSVSSMRGVNLTFMPIMIKAASLCLSAHPIINSSVDTERGNIVYKANHNIGIAMQTSKGLAVPVIKDVHIKNIFQLAKELNLLQDKGSNGNFDINDLTGATFTLSNIGVVGGTYTKPVISPPQVSIGAFGKIQVLPRFDEEGNVVKAHILSVSWAADHRVIDGVTMALFSNKMKEYLENPNLLLLEL